MKQYVSLGHFGVVAAVAVAVFVLAGLPAAAKPTSDLRFQTVPTRTPTPTRGYVPTDLPSPTPSEPVVSQPSPTAIPFPGATPTVEAGSVPGAPAPSRGSPQATAAPGTLGLTLRTPRTAVWPGQSVPLTLTLTNTGRVPIREILVVQTLPDEVEPGEVLSGEAVWTLRTLNVRVATLAPGARFTVSYFARIRPDAPFGGPLVLRASATARSGARATATLVLAMPPGELPPTGSRAPSRDARGVQ